MTNVKLSDIIPDDRNANRHTERGEYMLRRSLERFGFLEPGVLDANNRIIGGNSRAEAAADVLDAEDAIVIDIDGRRPVFVRRADLDLTTPEGREAAIALNRAAQVGIDFDPMALRDLALSGVDLEDWFQPQELREFGLDVTLEGFSIGDQPEEGSDRGRGYSLGSRDVIGRGLWTEVNFGFDVVARLKNTRPPLTEEIEFYGGLLARLVPPGYTPDLVSYAPSSRKVPDEEYFAAQLAGVVARVLNIDCVKLLENPNPRKHRAVRQEKLREAAADGLYEYVGGSADTPHSYLMVDDVIFTRRTAMRCQATLTAAGLSAPYWLVLYVA